ncbi:hypothetical protein K9O30_08315 [Clostridium bowmanii]|uniref:hypothetical protein n=1 Tax=Clostridium bowmanii TaxID=132925 RepID=UPI001C0AB64A|nr:hypothetical protein [Clostridium bowmanii]MBU3188869.1 hypothetical protein [Clostridium bowmanii]MCA1073725.1 hypothetical protein [Clostridium bowmanii]
MIRLGENNEKFDFIKNIKYLVTCDDDDSLFENINMYIENGAIKLLLLLVHHLVLLEI